MERSFTYVFPSIKSAKFQLKRISLISSLLALLCFAGCNKHGIDSSGAGSCYFQKTDSKDFKSIKIAYQCTSPDTAAFLYKFYILIPSDPKDQKTLWQKYSRVKQ
jgi:hypothetical protein